MKNLDERINGLIQLMEVPVWLVQPYRNIDCTCKDPTAKEGDPLCPNCLGFGQKISIREARAHIQPLFSTDNADNKLFLMRGYDIYIRNEFPVFPGDIIVFKDKIINVTYVMDWYSNTMDCVYYEANGVDYKRNPEAFMNNFKALIGD